MNTLSSHFPAWYDFQAAADQAAGKPYGEYDNDTFWLSPSYASKFYRTFINNGWALDLGDVTGNLYNKHGRRLFFIIINPFTGFHEVERMFNKETGEPHADALLIPDWAIGGRNRKTVRHKSK